MLQDMSDFFSGSLMWPYPPRQMELYALYVVDTACSPLHTLCASPLVGAGRPCTGSQASVLVFLVAMVLVVLLLGLGLGFWWHSGT